MARGTKWALAFAALCIFATVGIVAWSLLKDKIVIISSVSSSSPALHSSMHTSMPSGVVITETVLRQPLGRYSVELEIKAKDDLTKVEVDKLTLGKQTASGLPHRLGAMKAGEVRRVLLPVPGFKKTAKETDISYECSYEIKNPGIYSPRGSIGSSGPIQVP
jgi:hypothetical protein